MKKLLLILLMLCVSSCSTTKIVNMYVYSQDKVKIEVRVVGSELRDINPELSIPLIK